MITFVDLCEHTEPTRAGKLALIEAVHGAEYARACAAKSDDHVDGAAIATAAEVRLRSTLRGGCA